MNPWLYWLFLAPPAWWLVRALRYRRLPLAEKRRLRDECRVPDSPPGSRYS